MFNERSGGSKALGQDGLMVAVERTASSWNSVGTDL